MAQTVREEEAHGVGLSRVEQALSDLRGGDRAGSVRATTLNLVVHAAGEQDVSETLEVLETVGRSRPLRAIVVQSGEGDPIADVSSACWAGPGAEICTERIVVTAQANALPSAVESLLVADLPVFVWWQGPVVEEHLLYQLAFGATRLIVDSSEVGLDAVRLYRPRLPCVADLAWRRLAPWREAIASLFDGRAQRSSLDHMLGIEVRGPVNEGELLAGWLRSRLDRQIGLHMAGRSKTLNSVRLYCGDKEFVVRRLRRNDHGLATGPGLAEHLVMLPIVEPVRLVAAELDHMGKERVFDEALAALA
jgi:glucose-6-phosphate dehydrogenase assembly protein OpcA